MFEKVEVFKQRAPAGLQKTAPGTFWFRGLLFHPLRRASLRTRAVRSSGVCLGLGAEEGWWAAAGEVVVMGGGGSVGGGGGGGGPHGLG